MLLPWQVCSVPEPVNVLFLAHQQRKYSELGTTNVISKSSDICSFLSARGAIMRCLRNPAKQAAVVWASPS